jgi:hypothetical protein
MTRPQSNPKSKSRVILTRVTPVTRRVTLTKRDEDLIRQEALVFLFMLTRLHDDGTFDDSSAFIATAVMSGPEQRRQVSRAIERLIEKKAVVVIEKNRRDPKTGDLPMILKPVSPLPIWGGKIAFVSRPTGKDDSFLGKIRGVDRSHFVSTGPEGVRDHGGNRTQVAGKSTTSKESQTRSCPDPRPVVTATMSISSTDASQEPASIGTEVNGGYTPLPVTTGPAEKIRAELRDAEGKLRRIVAECGGHDRRIPGLKETIAKSQARLEELKEAATA